jgi:hypothetical protein
VNSCSFLDFVFADLDFERDLEADRIDVLFLELCGDFPSADWRFSLLLFKGTRYEAIAEVIKSARYFDRAFSAIFAL